MAIKTISCIVVTCDACGEAYGEDEVIHHFDSAEEAADLIDDDDRHWCVRADGRAVCPGRAGEHDRLRDALKAEAAR